MREQAFLFGAPDAKLPAVFPNELREGRGILVHLRRREAVLSALIVPTFRRLLDAIVAVIRNVRHLHRILAVSLLGRGRQAGAHAVDAKVRVRSVEQIRRDFFPHLRILFRHFSRHALCGGFESVGPAQRGRMVDKTEHVVKLEGFAAVLIFI